MCEVIIKFKNHLPTNNGVEREESLVGASNLGLTIHHNGGYTKRRFERSYQNTFKQRKDDEDVVIMRWYW